MTNCSFFFFIQTAVRPVCHRLAMTHSSCRCSRQLVEEHISNQRVRRGWHFWSWKCIFIFTARFPESPPSPPGNSVRRCLLCWSGSTGEVFCVKPWKSSTAVTSRSLWPFGAEVWALIRSDYMLKHWLRLPISSNRFSKEVCVCVCAYGGRSTPRVH